MTDCVTVLLTHFAEICISKNVSERKLNTKLGCL